MSTSTAVLDPPRIARDAVERPRLARLAAVELRKMVDTRAGFWLQLTVLAVTITALVLLAVFGDGRDFALRSTLAVAIWPGSVLLPVVGILLVTSEWSQRTTLITFTLVPQRLRVLVSKLLAGTALAALALAAGIVLAVPVTAALGSGVEAAWSVPVALLAQDLLFLVIAMITGIGFGAMLLSSAPAIVLSFVLPIAWSALGSIHALTGTAGWLDGSRSYPPMIDHVMSGAEWARVGTTLALWMLLPLAIGTWRVLRNELG
jgi:hypothetical protein